jgi:beta-lactamase regulating signal transducer with metallopeptidase domain
MAFILRIIMFFNPVVMVKFRRAVRDEEKYATTSRSH